MSPRFLTPPRFASLCLATLVALHARPASRNAVFPGTDWARATPQSQGVDPAGLDQAIRFLEEHVGRDGVRELVIARNGYLIWEGDNADKVHGIWSGTKSFTSTCLGLLIDEGKCELDTVAAEFVPEMKTAYPGITLRHFTTMTSGYRATGDAPRGGYTHGPSRTPFIPGPEPLFAPGSRYAYWDSAMNQFAHVLTRIAGEPLDELFRRRIADRIGMNPQQWRWGDFGEVENLRVNGGSGNSNRHVFISAKEMARFGWLFLNRGDWRGRRVLDPEWVRAATSVQVPASLPLGHPESGIRGSGVYGFNWWTNGRDADGRRKWPGAPATTFAASGYNNNDLFVIRDWNMVIVRLGLDQNDGAINDEEYGGFLSRVGEAITDTTVEGPRVTWCPLTLTFRGPQAGELDDAPNPFLDYRLQVRFEGPSGQVYDVPGYFDGDGRGGKYGILWRTRFSPDEGGEWSYRASFRSGAGVAISSDPSAGKPLAFDGDTGSFVVEPRDPDAPGFQKWGRLEYVGGHYLRFRDGPYWIRGGTDSPENFLAYAGFDNTPPSHHYADHREDWRAGDPDWNEGKGRAIIGALNSLASQGVNSLYFLTMNVGGDGGDVWPWSGSPKPKGDPTNDNLHFDLAKLHQWEIVFAHAQQSGIFLHFVLNEAERRNKQELDNGELGVERKLYYRELVARFGHHLALAWNLCEEYNIQFDFGEARVRAFADYLQAIDPYGHPITVHTAGDPLKELRFTFGDPRFSLTSIQLNQRRVDTLVEDFRRETTVAGRPLPISVDEFTVDVGQEQSHIPFDRADLHRKQKLWPVLFSGGQIEFILEGLLRVESFKTPARQALWRYVATARRFLEEHLPFWEMEPADERMQGEATSTVGLGKGRTFELGAQVFAKQGEVYAVYLPTARETGRLDLNDVEADLRCRWFNPREGRFEGAVRTVRGGHQLELGPVPREPDEDWVVLLERMGK